MSLGGDICWKRSFAGRNPSRVIVAGPNVALSYIDDQGEPATPGRHRLVCLDLEGRDRWSVRDFELAAALPDDRLVGVARSGELRVLDTKGRKCGGVRTGNKVVPCRDDPAVPKLTLSARQN